MTLRVKVLDRRSLLAKGLQRYAVLSRFSRMWGWVMGDDKGEGGWRYPQKIMTVIYEQYLNIQIFKVPHLFLHKLVGGANSPTWSSLCCHLHNLLSILTRIPNHPHCSPLKITKIIQIKIIEWGVQKKNTNHNHFTCISQSTGTWLARFEESKTGQTSSDGDATADQEKWNNS